MKKKIIYYAFVSAFILSLIYIFGRVVIEKHSEHFTKGWGEYYEKLGELSDLAIPLIKLVGLVGLVSCLVSAHSLISKRNEDVYLSILPIVSCSLISLSALFLAWGYGLSGMIGLTAYSVLQTIRNK